MYECLVGRLVDECRDEFEGMGMEIPLYSIFQAPLSLWDFFQLSYICPLHLKIGTCSLNIMLNNNFNFHTPWELQNPYDPRLN
jgi:hypothetical protein